MLVRWWGRDDEMRQQGDIIGIEGREGEEEKKREREREKEKTKWRERRVSKAHSHSLTQEQEQKEGSWTIADYPMKKYYSVTYQQLTTMSVYQVNNNNNNNNTAN